MKKTTGNARRSERYEKVLAHFRQQMPDVDTELEFGSVFQLLVAVILSAQCTDKRVNQVTPELFIHFPDAKTMAAAEPEDVLEYISSVSYPNAKSDHLVKMARILTERYGGEVPSDMNLLLELPGVGRKTANVIQSVAFGKSTLAVDTHVFRIANRLQLAIGTTPLEVERGLQKVIPKELWADAHHWLIWHGRKLCRARNPLCVECPLRSVCPYDFKGADNR